jgi:hypothetical protein
MFTLSHYLTFYLIWNRILMVWKQADVPAPSAPVASYSPKPVSPDTYTGAASKMAGASFAGAAVLAAAMLL